jgi:hypothetical protein
MPRQLRILAFVLVSVFFYQCQKEVSYIGGPDNSNIVTPAPTTATLQGNVVDENGQPAGSVSIKVGGQTATTDAQGYFRITNASLDKYVSLVTAEKAGYFKAYRTFSATSGTNQVTIKLTKKTLAGTIDGTTGGDITLSNGTKVALQAGGVVVASSGSAYTGTVNVYASYIDPTTADIGERVPGSFMANDKNGSRVTLASFGMMAVELESTAGEKLQIKSGSTATLTCPIPSLVQSKAPASIALWYVDEQTGLWKEEGIATKNGTNYLGEVKHFSFWNCDIGIPGIQLGLTLKNAAGQPLVHTAVRITRTSTEYRAESYGWTDSLGQVSGLVPSNETLVLDVLDPCNNSIYTKNIGPFAQNTNLGVVTVSNTGTSVLTVQGKLLNCSGTAVTDGFAMISYDNTVRYAKANATGDFSVSFTQCANGPSSLQVFGVDEGAQQQGTASTVTITAPATNTGNITACGTSSQQFINYTLDGSNHALTSAVSDSLNAFTAAAQGTSNLQTYIDGTSVNRSEFIKISFTSASATAGTYPITYITLSNSSSTNPSGSVVVTNFPTVIGDFYQGSFSATFSDTAGNHTVNGTFKVRKNF